MLLYKYYDIIFFFKCLKSPSSSFNINNCVSFASSSTRSSANSKLLHTKSTTNSSRHFYFNRLPRLWNSLPVLPWNNRLNHLSKISRLFFGTISSPTLILILHAPFISFAPVDHAFLYLYTIISLRLFDLSNRPSVTFCHCHLTVILYLPFVFVYCKAIIIIIIIIILKEKCCHMKGLNTECTVRPVTGNIIMFTGSLQPTHTQDDSNM